MFIETDEKNIKRVIIPSKEGSYCFNKTSYNEEYLEGLIGKSEYNKIIEEASKILGNALLKKRKNDHFEMPKYVYFFSILSFIFILMFIFGLYFSQNLEHGDNLFIVSIIFCILGLGITLIQSIYSFCRKTRKYFALEEIIKTDLDVYFDNINSTYYFTKVNNKYVFTGSLNFNYIPEKKHIECIIVRVDNRSAEIVEENEEDLDDSKAINEPDASINNGYDDNNNDGTKRNITMLSKYTKDMVNLNDDNNSFNVDEGRHNDDKIRHMFNDSVIKEIQSKNDHNNKSIISVHSKFTRNSIISAKELENELNRSIKLNPSVVKGSNRK